MIYFTKILILIVLMFAAIPVNLYPQQADSIKTYSIDDRLRVGEELTYIVKYAFINLGELKTVIESKDTIDGKVIYKTIAYIDSYEGLPFVDLHQIYKSWFDSTLFPVYFEGVMFYDEDTTFTKYFFTDDSIVHVIKGSLNPTVIYMDTVVNLHQRFQDGLSLLYYARFNFDKNDTTTVGCYINEDTSTTQINYYPEREAISIDAVDYDIDSRRLDGFTNFTGIFGLTGDFEGWFSNDIYLVPVVARLNVLIGSVVVELIDWNDKNWQPPEYKE